MFLYSFLSFIFLGNLKLDTNNKTFFLSYNDILWIGFTGTIQSKSPHDRLDVCAIGLSFF